MISVSHVSLSGITVHPEAWPLRTRKHGHCIALFLLSPPPFFLAVPVYFHPLLEVENWSNVNAQVETTSPTGPPFIPAPPEALSVARCSVYLQKGTKFQAQVKRRESGTPSGCN